MSACDAEVSTVEFKCAVCGTKEESAFEGDVARRRGLCDEHTATLAQALDGTGADAWRGSALESLRLLTVELEDSWIGARARKKSNKSLTQRALQLAGVNRALGPVIAAVVAAGGGAAATGGGSLRWIGIAVAVIGGIAAVILALFPVDEYLRNRAKDRRYERLLWDVWTYAVFVLPDRATTRASFYREVTAFTELRESAGDLSAPA